MTPPPGFDIKDFRQPVVTSLGVIVGFLLGYLGQWVTETDFVLRDPAQAYRYYRHTLRLYMGAVGLAIGAIGLSPFL